MGKPFSKSLHDGVTLKNYKKGQALSLQFIDTNWSRNFVVTIAFAQSKDGKAKKLYDIYKILTIDCIWFDSEDLWGLCLADGAAHKVEVIAPVEARSWLIHNGDKVGTSAVGEIIRTKMEIDINIFP